MISALKRLVLPAYLRFLFILFFCTSLIAVMTLRSNANSNTVMGIHEVVVFATNSVALKKDSMIRNGHVVVNELSSGSVLEGDAELSIDKGVSLPDIVTLKADSIDIARRARVDSDIFYNELSGQSTGNNFTPLILPVFAVLPIFQETILEPAGQDMTILAGETVTLDADNYGAIVVKPGGSLIFTGGIYNLRSLNGIKSAQILFRNSSQIRLAKKFNTGKNSVVGPETDSGLAASDIIFYVTGNNGEDEQDNDDDKDKSKNKEKDKDDDGVFDEDSPATNIGRDNTIVANFYVPNGTLEIDKNTNATGAFLARDVLIGKNVQLSLDSGIDKHVNAVSQLVTTEEEISVTIILTGDALAGVPLTFSIETNPDHGTLSNITQRPSVVQRTAEVTYTPEPDYFGDDGFNFEVCNNEPTPECAVATVSLNVRGINDSPAIISSPVITGIVGQAYSYNVEATDNDGDLLVYSLMVFPGGMSIDAGAGLITWTPISEGEFSVTVLVEDGQGGSKTQSFVISTIVSVVPPDPSTIAPPLDPIVSTSTFDATKFLYSGTNPIQTGVSTGTIEPVRAAVIRGKVLDKSDQPLPSVTVTIHNHPEFGQTISRADGMFDMAVNGGGLSTVIYQKTGYLTVQRQIETPWLDYAVLPDIVMTALDPQVTVVDLTSSTPIQVASGSVVTDSDGTRQAVLFIPQGTTATMVFPDGMSHPISTLSIRATEYTVGSNGPAAMPAPLPTASAYTYAVELSVDEAIAAGATEVVFSQPLYNYVENFLNFPVGNLVPSGYYDLQKGQWIPSPNGQIIQIVSVTGIHADIDVDGDGVADTGTLLSDLEITDVEREKLAGRYNTGQSLWRVPITHFTPHDYNWSRQIARQASTPSQLLPKGGANSTLDDPCTEAGSIIECENQTLGETLPLTGSSFSLNYRSDRSRGRKEAYTLEIPLGSTSTGIRKGIELEVTVAGRRFLQSFPAVIPSTTFEWDGLDAYGRQIQGLQTAKIRIGYVYDAFYTQPLNSRQFRTVRLFGLYSSTLNFFPILTRQDAILWQEYEVQLGVISNKNVLAGWNLSVHHSYDPVGKILHKGNGSRRKVNPIEKLVGIITTVVGNGDFVFSGDGGLATQTSLTPGKVTFGPDGSLYIADWFNHRIYRVGTDDIVTTVAGNGNAAFSGDDGPATDAGIGSPGGIAVDSDGSLYIATGHRNDDHINNNRIRKVSPDGIIRTISGLGIGGFSDDGGAATEAILYSPEGLAIGMDGSLYIAGLNESRIRKISSDGIITTVAGHRSQGFSGDEGLATDARLSNPYDVAIGTNGSLYIADNTNLRIRKVTSEGIITTVVGNGIGGFSGDGGLATQVNLTHPKSIEVGLDGSLYIADSNHRIRRVGTDGIITTVAGNGIGSFSGDEGLATKASLWNPEDVEIGPDGSLYIADVSNARVRKVTPTPSLEIIDIASEDGTQIYSFSSSGQHLETRNSLRNVHELT